MAYPIVSAPYGFKAENELGGLPYAGSTRMIPIATGYAANLFNGDLVQLSGGTLIKTAMDATSTPGTPVAGQIGVFVGCEYTNPGTLQRVRAQYWPSGTVAQDAVAYVIDDPRTVFKVAVTNQPDTLANNGTAIGYFSESFVGTNVYAITGAAGNTTSGDSAMSVSGDVIATGSNGNVRIATALPFRVVQLVPDTAVSVAAVASTSGSSTTVTLTAANLAIQAGMQLIAPTGTGSLAGNFITVTNVDGVTVTVNSAITLAASTAVTFIGYPEARVVWNQGFHSYTNAAGV